MLRISTITLIACFVPGFAAAQSFAWAKVLGSENNDWQSSYSILPKSIHLDDEGNVLSCGWSVGLMDFDPGIGVQEFGFSGRNSYISKLDNQGNYVWGGSLAYESANLGVSNEALDIASDNDGNIYVVGEFEYVVDFNPSVDSVLIANTDTSGTPNGYILKLNSDGEFLWVKTLEGSSSRSKSVAVDQDQNIYVGGDFYGTVDFDPGSDSANYTSEGSSDMFVLKLDDVGDFGFVKTFGGVYKDLLDEVVVDSAENVFAYGTQRGLIEIPTVNGIFENEAPIGSGDFILLKIDESFDVEWAGAWKGSGECGGLDLGENGFLYVNGEYSGSVDFDFGPGIYNRASTTGRDLFIMKVRTNGTFEWVETIDGEKWINLGDISVDSQGNSYSIGYTTATADFDPGSAVFELTPTPDENLNNDNIFILKLDNQGNFVWAKDFRNDDNMYGGLIDCHDNGDVYCTGAFRESGDFDPGPVEYILEMIPQGEDAFIVKLAACDISYGTESVTICNSYGGPSGNHLWTQTGTYIDILENSVGCDSMITVDLTIYEQEVDTAVTVDVYGNYFSHAANASWQWVNCAFNYTSILGKTDSVFTPNGNGSYAVIINDQGCVDTSACISIDNVGIWETDEENQFSVFPNPTSDSFFFSIKSDQKPQTVSIYGCNGKLIQEKSYDREVDVSKLSEGFYIIKLLFQDGTEAYERLVIQ